MLTRVEYWREYREKIMEKSRKIENPLDSKELSKIYKSIKSINPRILNDLKIEQLKMPDLIKINDTINKNYFDSISFGIESFNDDKIKEIDSELKLASNSGIYDFSLDSYGFVELSTFDKSDSLLKLKNIKEQIINVEKDIQFFPKESKKDLEKLNLLVETAKKDHNQQKLTEFQFEENKKDIKNKKIFWLAFISLLTIALITFILFLVVAII